MNSRFEEKIERIPECGCWIWLGYCDKDGYGHFRKSTTQVCLAHRASWEFYTSPIPDGMDVLHRCDTPFCVNPHHLFLGTHQDNMDDMTKKERANHPCGNLNGNAKLNERSIFAIRSDDRSQRIIAKEHRIGQATVSLIKAGKLWAHI